VLCAVSCAVCGTLKQWDSKAVCSGMARQWSRETPRLRCCVTVRQGDNGTVWQWGDRAVNSEAKGCVVTVGRSAGRLVDTDDRDSW
jgi:hypothetical protein